MKVFINEVSVRIVKLSSKLDEANHELVIMGGNPILSKHLKGNVLVKQASRAQMIDVVKLLASSKLNKLDSIVFAFEKKKKAIKYFKKHFDIVEAAGGIVRKGKKILLIHRKGKWDLPKGKAEKGESIKQTAIREVEEECCVKVKLDKKIGETYHTYMDADKMVLKKTFWYSMTIREDKKMRPQKEEDIDKVRWKSHKQTEKAFKNTYNSIRSIYSKYLKTLDVS